ncbi:MAG: glycoside hydrolase family 26 protein [Prolixibacteraceae bacterium]
MNFKTHILIALLIFLASSCYPNNGVVPEEIKETEIELNIVDKQATNQTKALLSNLWAIQQKGTMFGHHDDLWYGRTWYNEPGRSDVKEVCGDYPAVFSVDFAEVMDMRSATSSANSIRKRVILEARSRGEVITACCHLNNPLTGGDAWDNSNNNVVKEILTKGSATNLKFKGWLDKLAVFANNLEDENGDLIPVIFRPFHEHTQTWSWWGKKCTTDEEFIGLWKFTIEYLRDEKGVHNLLYAISPQMDGIQQADDLLFRYPGDEYVDFLGMDCYHGTNTDAFISNLTNLAALSKQKQKPCGVTETGVEGILKNGAPYAEYWTKEILTPLIGRKVSMVVMWRNAYDQFESGHHFYGPYPGHASEKDFIRFYRSEIIFFSKDLPNMYLPAEQVIVF